MPLVTDPLEVEEIYAEVREKNACLAAFNTESPEGTEAILRATAEMARDYGVRNPPAIVAFTGNYEPRPGLQLYTGVRDAMLGFKALLSDVESLVSGGSPYQDVRVMLHFDHAQPGPDEELLALALDELATVMYDCSHFSMEENIERTARFVEETKDSVRVEGAVDEIYEAGSGITKNVQTDPQQAQRFVRETGVFLIVPNVGTEHRATKEEAQYNSERAREISRRVGKMLVLHGSSSLYDSDLSRLKNDGIIKVNIWTLLARVGGQAVAESCIRRLGNILDEQQLRTLQAEGFLGPRYFEKEYIDDVCGGELGPKLSTVPEVVRRTVWMNRVVKRMRVYMEEFGYRNLA